jgi:3-methyl-2-oxobutanoate hydroxymethyltransferase
VYRNFQAEFERLQNERVAAFSEFRADVDGGRYPEPDHNVAVADDVYGQFVEYLDSAV